MTRGSNKTGRVNLQSCMNKPRSTLVFTNLPYQSSLIPSVGAFFVSFCFENMLNYGFYSALWAPFSLKTLLEERVPARARQVRRTVEFAAKVTRTYQPCSQ